MTNNLDSINDMKLITTSSIISPFMTQTKKDNKVICAKVEKGINILYSPKALILPTVNEDIIEVIDKDNFDIILDTSDIKIKSDNNTIIYTKFKYNIVNEKEYSYVDKYDVNYKININNVLIEKRNKNER